MSDSAGMIIQIENPNTWTIGAFYDGHCLQPSKY